MFTPKVLCWWASVFKWSSRLSFLKAGLLSGDLRGIRCRTNVFLHSSLSQWHAVEGAGPGGGAEVPFVEMGQVGVVGMVGKSGVWGVREREGGTRAQEKHG